MIVHDHLEYIARPFDKPMDPVMETLSSILDSISMQYTTPWSFAGGIARDLYLGLSYNDFDIVSPNPSLFISELEKSGFYERGQPANHRLQAQDYFIDPYSPGEKHPIHIFQTLSNFGYAPLDFDFTLNQIALKSNGYFYAPKAVWKDLDNGIIRKSRQHITTTLLMRTLRFTYRLGFEMDQELSSLIKERIQAEPMDSYYFVHQAKKMITDGVDEPCFLHMQRLGLKEIQGFDDLSTCIQFLEARPREQHHTEAIHDFYEEARRQERIRRETNEQDWLPF